MSDEKTPRPNTDAFSYKAPKPKGIKSDDGEPNKSTVPVTAKPIKNLTPNTAPLAKRLGRYIINLRPKTNNNGPTFVSKSPVMEGKESHVVATFGRMNPPTAGHQKLVDKMHEHAKQVGGDVHVYLSQTTDRKANPLSYEDKLKAARKAFGHKVVQHAPGVKTAVDVARHLSGKYDHLHVVAGADRVDDYKRILNTYNGKEFNFKTVNVVSSGARDPDAEGLEGASATKVRAFAASNNRSEFKKNIHPRLRGDSSLFTKVRAGLGLHEEDEVEHSVLREYNALAKKAMKKGIPYEVLREVYERGVNEDEDTAFDRVNSFIAKGRAWKETDADLAEQVNQRKRVIRRIVGESFGNLGYQPGSQASIAPSQFTVDYWYMRPGELIGQRAQITTSTSAVLGISGINSDFAILEFLRRRHPGHNIVIASIQWK